jgi:hypothetical protein
LSRPPRDARCRAEKQWKNKERRTKRGEKEIFIFSFFILGLCSPTHRTMCPSTHDSVFAWRSISRQVANVKCFLKNLANCPETRAQQGNKMYLVHLFYFDLSCIFREGGGMRRRIRRIAGFLFFAGMTRG